jgi:hypothetical protein
MPGPVAAIAGAGIASAGASIFGANKASQSAKDAAKEQTKATYAAIAAEKDALNKQIALQEPFREVGVNALSQYAGASAPSYKPFGVEQFNADPGYQFRMSEGLKALERSASARGILSSGQTLKDITRFGQDTASQEYQNAFTRYMAETQRMREEKMAPLEYQIGLGQAAASGQAANIGTSAGSTSNLLTGLGNINAQRAVTQGNVMSGLAGNIGSIAGQAAQGYADYQAAQPYQNYLRSISPQGVY